MATTINAEGHATFLVRYVDDTGARGEQVTAFALIDADCEKNAAKQVWEWGGTEGVEVVPFVELDADEYAAARSYYLHETGCPVCEDPDCDSDACRIERGQALRDDYAVHAAIEGAA